MNENQSREIRIATQRTQGLGRLLSAFCGEIKQSYDRQETLAMLIAATTLASDTPITIVQFHQSKLLDPKRFSSCFRATPTVFGPAPLQKCVRDFCCRNFGGFCRGFSWRIFLLTFTFSHKMRRKKSGDKIRGKIRRIKKKIR